MRITHVPYTKKRVTTLDLVQTDEVLYRDEEWLARDKDTTGLNTRYISFIGLKSFNKRRKCSKFINKSQLFTFLFNFLSR